MSMKSKIAALLRKAESSTFKEEAETFLAKARELMEKHQIDFSEGRAEVEEGTSNRIETNRTTAFDWGTPAAVRYDLEAAVAQFFGIRVLIFRVGKRAWYEFHGAQSALITHDAMFPFIWKQVGKLASQNGATSATQRKLKRDISRALTERMGYIKARRDWETRRAAGTGTGTALVLVGIEDDIDAHIRKLYPDMGEAKARKLKAPSALATILAEEVALDAQVKSNEAAPARPLAAS